MPVFNLETEKWEFVKTKEDIKSRRKIILFYFFVVI